MASTTSSITLGIGRLDWPEHERAGDTYAFVTLDSEVRGAGTNMEAAFAGLVRFDERLHGLRGTLSAQVIAPAEADSTPPNPAGPGEQIVLGHGTLQVQTRGPGHAAGTPWTTPRPDQQAPVLIGTIPDRTLSAHEPRMDAAALERLARAKVTLVFEPECS